MELISLDVREITPFILFSPIMKANDEKLNLSLRLSLVSSVSWVTVPDHLVLMNTGLFKLLGVLKAVTKLHLSILLLQ